MSQYQLSGPAKIRRLDGYTFTLPLATLSGFMQSALHSESVYRDMADTSKVRAGAQHSRPVFRFELGGLTPDEASDIVFALEVGEFYFTPRTQVAGDTGEETEYRVRVTSALKLSEAVHLQGKSAIRMQVSLEGVEGVVIVPATPTVLFTGNDDAHYYTMSADFSKEIDTGLDLTTEDIISMDLHRDSLTVYGLSDTGKVYSWGIDGSNLQEVLDTGFADLLNISIDNVNDWIVVSRHQAAIFNHRTYAYTLAGSAVWNWENRYQTAILQEGFHANGATGYYYLFSTGAGAAAVLFRFDMATGITQQMQVKNGTQLRGWCMDEIGNAIYHVLGSALILFDPVTVNNPAQGAQIGAGIPTNNSTTIDIFRHLGTPFLVGCGGSKIWSYDLSGPGFEANRSTANARCLCTVREYATPP